MDKNRNNPMQSIRLMGMVLIAATWMGLHSSTARADTTLWSTSAAACVPMNPSGLFITAGAVTAQAGATVTLYCGITGLAGGFETIEITHRGGVGVVSGDVNTPAARAIILTSGFVNSELVEMSKATGGETVKCEFQPPGSATIKSERNLCNHSDVDFNNNFYYLRITLKSGIAAGQQVTVFGSSLICTAC